MIQLNANVQDLLHNNQIIQSQNGSQLTIQTLRVSDYFKLVRFTTSIMPKQSYTIEQVAMNSITTIEVPLLDVDSVFKNVPVLDIKLV